MYYKTRYSDHDDSLHILIILQKTPARLIAPWEFVLPGLILR